MLPLLFGSMQHNLEILNHVHPRLFAGNEKLSSGQAEEAIELYNKAISLNPNSAVYYGNRYIAL